MVAADAVVANSLAVAEVVAAEAAVVAENSFIPNLLTKILIA